MSDPKHAKTLQAGALFLDVYENGDVVISCPSTGERMRVSPQDLDDIDSGIYRAKRAVIDLRIRELVEENRRLRELNRG